MLIPKAICVHEEDAGVLWKHSDCHTGHAEVRRSRRLVVSMVSTFSNYEYAVSHQLTVSRNEHHLRCVCPAQCSIHQG